MPRRARITLANVPHHIIQRGNNRSACFHADADYRTYLTWLEQYAMESQCDLHAFVLMTNHVHLLVTPNSTHGVSKMMKSLGQRYAQYINRTYQRSGTLWEGRFKSCVVGEEAYLLGCYRYIELNPVRANIVQHPTDYEWSSYKANAQNEPCSLITPHNLYLSLGLNIEERLEAYRNLIQSDLKLDLIKQIRRATNSNYALGSQRFCAEIETSIGRRATPGTSGRPW